eukprot:TRINITY_DN21696_c0_g1_i1.p1 TRINITY_DN21696_c0_g1~~TRINITY_DN21696_c0_g1_i1.p1  ORF type:complete len:198 (+),score=47.60 TRINITY_DN21696_c0_g1_i1:74-667(+)
MPPEGQAPLRYAKIPPGARETPFSWLGDGVLAHIGEDFGRSSWVNPAVAKRVIVSGSTVWHGDICEFVDKEFSTQRLFTNDEPLSWLQVELPVAVRPTHYRLSHREGLDQHFLRDWTLLGSFDGKKWYCLCDHQQDSTLCADCHTGCWELPGVSSREYFPFFRVCISPGGNSEGSSVLVACCFEVFGKFRQRCPPAP